MPPLLGPPKSEFLDAPAPAKGPNNNATLSRGPRRPDGSTDPGNSHRRPASRRNIHHTNNNYDLERIVFNHSHQAAGRFAPEGGHSSDRDASPFTGGAGPSQHIGHFPIPAFPPYTVRTLHFHGGPATEGTTRTGACAALALILRGASPPQDPDAPQSSPEGPR